MAYAVEAWTIPQPDDEEPCEHEMVEDAEFQEQGEAETWAWNRLEEGYFVRMWRRH